MGRTLLILVVLAGLGYALYIFIIGRAPSATAPSTLSEPSAPKQTIDNARRAAKQIEDDAQRRADELMEKTR